MIKTVDNMYDEYFNVFTERKLAGDGTTEPKFSLHYYPTSYTFLERLFQVFPFEEEDHLIDFGCGKGRVLFMASACSCKYVIGYENDNSRYNTLEKNVRQYVQRHKPETHFTIQNKDVQKITIAETANKFFFFNPFHLKVYIHVIRNIQESFQRKERDISVFLYRPQQSTIKYLDTVDWLHKEISVDYVFSSVNKKDISVPQFVFYCNYPLRDSIDQYSFAL